MKPVAESSKAADTERFEREVGVWKKERADLRRPAQSTHHVAGNQPNDQTKPNNLPNWSK